MSDYDFDIAVAGGGPAGTSAAITLAQRGRAVILFERDLFPRFHIGESLLSTANDSFAALGLTEKMDAGGFPVKWGARQRKRFETFRRFVIGFYSPAFRDLFFNPEPPKSVFRAVVTVLCGRWDASPRTRILNWLFFGFVAIQKRWSIVRPRFGRGTSAGYP